MAIRYSLDGKDGKQTIIHVRHGLHMVRVIRYLLGGRHGKQAIT